MEIYVNPEDSEVHGRDQEEPGMTMQVIRKAPEEKPSNCPHNIIDQSILLTTDANIKL